MRICLSLSMESLATLETLTNKARFEKSIAASTTFPGKLLLCHTKLMDCLLLSVIVCLFGPWVGCHKGAT